ncbi:hypothetical protein CONCODRAFT_168326 [Conidiobolus coronatus NRRL 28638]|uniref:Uncharacterized protein n=1 Tax=Conidiobolus coronatus (strain ATCC 28846 / CBS 209.66 / NRRL 28638) TaxID=796925 RepID=A0A137PIF5_CONC2|nr:hypothetical protein CONCODRAFT_168326 [Conidiobolus coronatus NRRL 28638]|eukprot:KXN74769.1 hypothetical protein CONCODRAFT_168326 [Conidiobolus coronatus NRRL 28638]
MSLSTESYNQFISSIESSDSIEAIERMAQISQMRRRSPGIPIFTKGSNESSASSISSESSAKSITPSALDLKSAFYQKGFDNRQFDSSTDFDNIIDHGYSGDLCERMSTLKLTLTPEVLRR